jgi:hypothetical protein
MRPMCPDHQDDYQGSARQLCAGMLRRLPHAVIHGKVEQMPAEIAGASADLAQDE